MSLTANDLFHRETLVRTEAERMRLHWPKTDLSSPEVSADVKTRIRTMNERADHLDQVGDLLMALQDDWGRYGPMLRESHGRMLARSEAMKAQDQTVEDAA